MNELTTKWRYNVTLGLRYNKSKVNLTLLGNWRDLTGVQSLVEVSISYSLTRDVPGPGWWCEGYEDDERYHRQIGQTISTAWNPLHMVLCPLILSLPFHCELVGRQRSYLGEAGYVLCWSRDVITSRQMWGELSHQTTIDQCPLSSLVSPLLSVFLGLHGHLSLSV